AGIAGLTAAYELQKAGYHVLILEPQQRAGGRSLTARRGTVVTEKQADGKLTHQECTFDEGLYLNMGPGRLPYHHRRVLYYCHVLGVPLEVYTMSTTANLWQRQGKFGGEAKVRRRLQTDAQGYIAELLAKQVCKGHLNSELTANERKCLLELLVTFGDLNATGSNCVIDPPPPHVCNPPEQPERGCPDPACTKEHKYEYCGSTRSGCATLNIFDTCTAPEPVPLRQLLESQFWAGASGSFYQPLEFEWQPTLFQPVGGMDMIWKGFLKQVGSLISYRSEVTGLRLFDDGVEVEYLDQYSGKKSVLRADYCLSNIPLPILQRIPANFAPDYKEAVDTGCFAATCKVGWQANQRFWENDTNQIYGGISYIDSIITQVWYPSYQYFEKKGTLTGAYNYPPQANRFGELSLKERLRVAREEGARLHREFRNDAIVPEAQGISIAWHKVPYQEGGWAVWGSESASHADAYERLLAPDRRFHMIGDQVSTLPGWQEGAMMSAEHVVEQIAGKRPLTVPDIKRAPDTRRLTQG
ncbi:MAG TPA: FAD-dependent oxidoreductase, partial [Vicinamibacterales bacterium]|nr:FAD-dependent oxidoreductase [Vicinamibacterales bacterium]